MDDSDFLSFLVDETFKHRNTDNLRISSFEQKLSDYGLNFFKGEFIPQSQMLRFDTKIGAIDIPINWSIFDIANYSEGNILLTRDNDQDHVLEIFQEICKKPFRKLLVTHADGFCYIVGLKTGEEHHLHDLLNPQELLSAA